MPPGCHENFTAKGEVPEMLHLGRVPGSKWLFSEWDVDKDKETIWVAITTALQRHLPGKFKSPDELRARLSTYVLSSLSHEDFYICFPCCEGVMLTILLVPVPANGTLPMFRQLETSMCLFAICVIRQDSLALSTLSVRREGS
jgi:hypothetical protein